MPPRGFFLGPSPRVLSNQCVNNSQAQLSSSHVVCIRAAEAEARRNTQQAPPVLKPPHTTHTGPRPLVTHTNSGPRGGLCWPRAS